MEWVLLHPFHLFYAHYHLLLLKKSPQNSPPICEISPQIPISYPFQRIPSQKFSHMLYAS